LSNGTDYSTHNPENLSWTRLSVLFSSSVAPIKKPSIVILRKAFAIKQMSLKNVQLDE
jgi:hypothetical protein